MSIGTNESENSDNIQNQNHFDDTDFDINCTSEKTLFGEHEQQIHQPSGSSTALPTSQFTKSIDVDSSQVTQSLVNLTYLTMEYGIRPEAVNYYQATNPDPDSLFGPYGTFGLDWFLIPHYSDFFTQNYSLQTLEYLRIDPEMVEQEAQQAL